ncbi:hypothetical protein T05_10084 [Trichinella murrelli]|uniref:Uncharacterized protein n=1 Tax=Trichinella murrelli TaxID=144512 RepID=A0A0V0TLV4_9BILA|nr:hypothetical protein T05_10084 [Trichinella murrelli]
MKNTFSSDCQMILKSKYFMVQRNKQCRRHALNLETMKKEKEKAHTKPIAWNLSYQLSLM